MERRWVVERHVCRAATTTGMIDEPHKMGLMLPAEHNLHLSQEHLHVPILTDAEERHGRVESERLIWAAVDVARLLLPHGIEELTDTSSKPRRRHTACSCQFSSSSGSCRTCKKCTGSEQHEGKRIESAKADAIFVQDKAGRAAPQLKQVDILRHKLEQPHAPVEIPDDHQTFRLNPFIHVARHGRDCPGEVLDGTRRREDALIPSRL